MTFSQLLQAPGQLIGSLPDCAQRLLLLLAFLWFLVQVFGGQELIFAVGFNPPFTRTSIVLHQSSRPVTSRMQSKQRSPGSVFPSGASLSAGWTTSTVSFWCGRVASLLWAIPKWLSCSVWALQRKVISAALSSHSSGSSRHHWWLFLPTARSHQWW